jgi:hypothetical protein
MEADADRQKRRDRRNQQGQDDSDDIHGKPPPRKRQGKAKQDTET